MVFIGKRSPACAECRKRKTKCDLAVPECGQCIRTKRECSGPRNNVDVMFIHQTRKVARKSRPQERLLVNSTSPSSDDISQSRYGCYLRKPPSPLSYVLHQSLDELGINWFMRNRRGHCSSFVMQHGFFSAYHYRLGDTDIIQSLKAVGLAGYAKETQQNQIKHAAERSYAKAVRSVNDVLSKTDIAFRDGALFSVMMLAMFEGNTWRRASGMKNFMNHINGLISLGVLSAKQTELSTLHREFLAFILRVFLFQCWSLHMPLPQEFFIVSEVALFDPLHIQTKLKDLVISIVQFQTSAQHGLLDFRNLLSDVTKIDLSIQGFLDHIPPSCRWSEQIIEGPRDLVYQGYIHFYPSTHVALHHNKFRFTRVHFNLILIEKCRTALRDSTHQQRIVISNHMAASEAAVKRVVRDICASVPQLGDYLDRLNCHKFSIDDKCYLDAPHQSTTALLEFSPFLTYNPGPFKKSRTRSAADGSRRPKLDTLYHVFWMLLPLIDISFLDSDMKDWIKGRLLWIEENGEPEDIDILRAMRRRMQARVNVGLYRAYR